MSKLTKVIEDMLSVLACGWLAFIATALLDTSLHFRQPFLIWGFTCIALLVLSDRSALEASDHG